VHTGLSGHKTTVQAGDGSESTTELVIGGETLQPGKTIEIHGTTLSFATLQTGIYVNGEFSTVPTGAADTAFTVGGIPVTPTVVGPSGGAASSSFGAVATGDGVRLPASWYLVGLSCIGVIVTVGLF
jgi:hypothetical protein